MNDGVLYLFMLADVLGINLYEDKDEIKGSMVRPFRVGPWQDKANVFARIDFAKFDGAAMLVKVRKHLWFYVVAGPGKLHLIAFDGHKAGAKTARLEDFCTGDLNQTMAKIKSHIGAIFEFDNTLQKWMPLHAPSLDRQAQSPSLLGDQRNHMPAP